jgi:hypothetical protein
MTPAITHPVILDLRRAGYDLALTIEAHGIALRVWSVEVELVVRAADAGRALEFAAQWLVSRERR